jgi:hypothetical protein
MSGYAVVDVDDEAQLEFKSKHAHCVAHISIHWLGSASS